LQNIGTDIDEGSEIKVENNTAKSSERTSDNISDPKKTSNPAMIGGVSVVGGLVIIGITTGSVIYCVNRRRRRKCEQNSMRKDDNPLYGLYYGGQVDYTTVEDTNDYYVTV